MRLLHINAHGTLALTKDLTEKVPPYAILSHTWGDPDDEVLFEDMQNDTWRTKKAKFKLDFCAAQAKLDGFSHFWIDTCCIDKRSSAELQEAITSMFRWYAQAQKCYVLLNETTDHKRDCDGNSIPWTSSFSQDKWFTRGWTLQELIAPQHVEFYSRNHKLLGNKLTLRQQIHEITAVPKEALSGGSLQLYSVTEKLSWATKRATTRIEDRAYCLLGIFGVSMNVRYGDGDKVWDHLMDAVADAYRHSLPRVEQAGQHVTVVSSKASTTVPVHRDEVLKSLDFVQNDSRRSTIKKAYSSTCQWLLQHPHYVRWSDSRFLHDHYGFLWLKGKPGAGKSVLMKHAHANTVSTKTDDDIVLAFFFNARGEELEKSTVGMYRSLLFQLLNQAPDLQDVLDTSHAGDWTVDVLCKLLRTAICRLGHRELTCFIDALDECDEWQIELMVRFLEETGAVAAQSNIHLYTCFASRLYPSIDIQHGLQLVLEDQPGHAEDLAKYVRSHLKAGTSKSIPALRDQIIAKANGVFLWVVLVIPILNREFRDGRVFALKRRLKEIPEQLHKLFEKILLRDTENLADLLLALQWILLAFRPLTSEEFYFAMLAGLEPESVSSWDPDIITTETMSTYVLASTKGLAEMTKSKTPTVQFIHESVRDYLIKEKGFQQLWPHHANDAEAIGHERLKSCCASYLQVDLSNIVPSDLTLPQAKSQEGRELRQTVYMKFPFLGYASQYVWQHAESAASTVPQNTFLGDLDLSRFKLLSNILEIHQTRRYGDAASLLFILAERDCTKLISSLPSSKMPAMTRDGIYSQPIFSGSVPQNRLAVLSLLRLRTESAHMRPEIGDIIVRATDKAGRTPLHQACIYGWADAVQPLLNSGADPLSRDKKGYTAVEQAMQQDGAPTLPVLVSAGAFINADIETKLRGLSCASKNGYKDALNIILDQGVDVGATYILGSWQEALNVASQNGDKRVVEVLLGKSADMEGFKPLCNVALLDAVSCGQTEVVKVLLSHGADIEVTDPLSKLPALHLAALRGHNEVAEVLLSQGAAIESTNGDDERALHVAARYGRKEVVEVLLRHGADIEAVAPNRSRALHMAADYRRDEVVKLLASKGAGIEAADRFSRRVLHTASRLCGDRIVEFLLSRGADVGSSDVYGAQALHYAYERQKQTTVTLLLSWGADSEATDKHGRRPHEWAPRVNGLTW